MKIGFIGAGKMGYTMGKHLSQMYDVRGYYSNSQKSAKDAARFTDTYYYDSIENLVEACDVIFITTPDSQIEKVANELMPILADSSREIILVHTSGALSSYVFSGMGDHVYGYSIHPVYAVNSKTESYLNFKDAFITIEGDEKYLSYFVDMYSTLGHSVKIISGDNKVKYHAAAVFASNLMCGMFRRACNLLMDCGFTSDEARCALGSLHVNNANNLRDKDIKEALTGPVARCDVGTVSKHMEVLSGVDDKLYRLLSKELIKIMINEDNKDRYMKLKELLDE